MAAAAPDALAATGTVTVKPTASDGTPVGGACFEIDRIAGDGSQSRVDAFCTASLGATRQLEAGQYELEETQPPDQPGRILRPAPPRRFTVTAGSNTTVTVEHLAGAGIDVQAKLPSGELTHGCFEARAGGDVVDRGCVGLGNSPAQLRVPTGPITVRMTGGAEGHIADDLLVTTSLDQRYSRVMQLREAPGGLRIAQVRAEGGALEGGCWSLYKDGYDAGYACDAYDGATDGSVLFRRLKPGRYTARNFEPPQGRLMASDVEVEVADTVVDATRTFEPMGAIRVRATHGEGGPLVPGACWQVAYPDTTEGHESRHCDADDGADDGVTHFPDVAEGEWDMQGYSVPAGYDRIRGARRFTAGADDVTLTYALTGKDAPPPTDPDPKPDPEPAPPVNRSLPPVTGPMQVGGVLTGGTGEWAGDPTAFAYAWERCDADGASCVLIPGADRSHLTLTKADAGHRLRLAVTATNAQGSTRVRSEPTALFEPVPPANVELPTVRTVFNNLAIASPGRWTSARGPITYAYQWQRCAVGGECTDVPGATDAAMMIGAGLDPHYLRVRVTATDTQGSTTVASPRSQLVGRPVPVNLELPTIGHDGDPQVGEDFRASPGRWAVSTGDLRFEHRWQLCTLDDRECRMLGEKGRELEFDRRYNRHLLRVVVTAIGRGGEVTRRSAPLELKTRPPVNTAAPTISGDPRVGERLSVDPGAWRSIGKGLRFEYIWVRCESTGANCFGDVDQQSSRYRVQRADWGRRLKATVIAYDSEGRGEPVQTALTPVIQAER